MVSVSFFHPKAGVGWRPLLIPPSMHMETCKKQHQLSAVYRRTIWNFGVAVDGFQAAYAILGSAASYRQVQRDAEEAQVLSEQAWANLEKHVQEHGCYG
jgi:hypothetical protein